MPLQSWNKRGRIGPGFGALSVTETPIQWHKKSNFAADYLASRAFQARAKDFGE
jgi:hypothetical protein